LLPLLHDQPRRLWCRNHHHSDADHRRSRACLPARAKAPDRRGGGMSVGAVETPLGSRARVKPTASERPREAMYERGPRRYFVLTLLIVAAVLTLFPFFLAAINAVKAPTDYGAHGPIALPRSFDLTALKVFWREVNFGEKLFNSALISGSVAVCGVVISL